MPSVKTALKTCAERLGWEIRRADQATASKHSQRALLLGRLGVDVVLDVGANTGQYAGTHLRKWSAYKGGIASFEPVRDSYVRCEVAARGDSSWSVFDYGLSDVEGALPMHVPAGQTDLSSLHQFTAAGREMVVTTVTRAETVMLRRLDDVIGALCASTDRLALKLDVQGHEGAVLRGGERTLKRVVLIECEMPLIPMYEGGESFGDLLATLAAAGFFPVGMQTNYVDSSTGCAFDADVFLVRKHP